MPSRRKHWTSYSRSSISERRSWSLLVLVSPCLLAVSSIESAHSRFVLHATVPDFRSRTGLFSTTHKQNVVKATGKHLFDASVYKTDAATTQFHDMVRTLAHLAESSKPTEFHQFLARLAEEGRLLRLYTQNVDGLDVALPSLATNIPLNSKAPWPRTIQLHGGLGKMVCQKCHHLSDFEAALFEGPDPPPCQECKMMDAVRTNIAGKRSHGVGRLRPRMVLYNEHNPDEDAIGAVTRSDLRSRPDALIVVGTSLKVRGVRRIVKEMCGVVRGRRDGLTVWINSGAQPVGKDFEDCWDLVVRSDSDFVAQLADGKLSEPPVAAGEEIDERQWVDMKSRDEPQVVLKSPTKIIKREEMNQSVMAPVGNLTAKLKAAAGLKSKDGPSKTAVRLKLNPPKGGKKPAATKITKPRKNNTTTSKSATTKAKAKKAVEAKSVQKISGVFKTSKATISASVTQKKTEPKSDVAANSKGLLQKPNSVSEDAISTAGNQGAISSLSSRKRRLEEILETPSPSSEQQQAKLAT